MRIYISGKITGEPDFLWNFMEAEAELKIKFPQAQIINPARVSTELPFLNHAEYMKISFAEMDACDTVFFLRNWRRSRGACMEFGYAAARRMKMIFQKER